MSVLLAPAPAPTADLGSELLAHLDAQIASTERLLEGVLRQGEAIRDRDVEGVLVLLAAIQQEMDARGRLELQRATILRTAAARLGIAAADVTLDRMAALLSAPVAGAARERSAHLRGLLAEIEREHGVNRALMRQELSFLDHLVRLMGGEAEGPAYTNHARRPAGAPTASLRGLDLTA
jgi:hypothetical protein